MDHGALECSHEKIIKMFPGRVSGGGGGRKRAGVLSGMIIWNVLVLILLVLAVCVQGRGGAVPSDTSSNLALRRLTREITKKDKPDADTPVTNPTEDPRKPAGDPAPGPQAPQAIDPKVPKDSQPAPKSSGDSEKKEGGEGGKEGGGDAQVNPENKSGNTNTTTKVDAGNGSSPHIPGMSSEAVLRGFYVFVGIGAIILIYIVIKLARLRKRRAPGKYRVLSHTDDQEMFPLAAGEGEDEEIFNAAHHQLRK